MTKDEYRNTVRITDDERSRLLNELDRVQTVASKDVDPHDSRRQYRRYKYRPGHISITVEQPGGVSTRLSVSPRNISAGGLAFLHGGFLYAGSRCTLRLGLEVEDSMKVGGQIVNCRHVEGILHEVSVKFDLPIDPGLFVEIDEKQEAAPSEETPPQRQAS